MITMPMYAFITIVVLAFIITLIMVYFAGKYMMLTSQFDFLEDEIERTLEEEKSKSKPHWYSEEKELNQGWIEALQYSLRQVRFARILTSKEIDNVNKKS